MLIALQENVLALDVLKAVNLFYCVSALQVVGVIRKGLDCIELLDDVPRSPDDTPLMRIKVVKCGSTNAEVGSAYISEWL